MYFYLGTQSLKKQEQKQKQILSIAHLVTKLTPALLGGVYK